jgi:hypothetical protein
VVSTNQDLKNKFRIYNIVKNNFGLAEESLKLFRFRLFQEPHIAPEYAKILEGSKDPLRLRVDITGHLNFLEDMDSGWREFRRQFAPFIFHYKMTYSDFRENKVRINKQEMKIQKALVSYYATAKSTGDRWEHHHSKGCIQSHMESIGKCKLSNKKKTELVLSLNFADWFLCSTKETWGSCLNLESDYESTFWSGLPGLIGDKNRAMLYLTDGIKKNYHGIEVDRIMSRSWILTVRPKVKNSHREDRSNSMFLKVGEYPTRMGLDNMAEKLWNMKWWGENERRKYEGNFISRYYLEYLFHQGERCPQGKTSYIYQDNTSNKLGKKNKGKISPGKMGYLRPGGGNINRWTMNGQAESSSLLYYTGGLGNLIENDRHLMENDLNYSSNSYCCGCDCELYDEDIYHDDNNNIYCEDCYNETFCECEDCGDILNRESDYTYTVEDGFNNYYVCENCYGNNYVECSHCGGVKSNDSTIVTSNTDNVICEECLTNYKKRYFWCEKCDQAFEITNKSEEPSEVDGIMYCQGCHEKKLYEKQRELDFSKPKEELQVASVIVEDPNAMTIQSLHDAHDHMSRELAQRETTRPLPGGGRLYQDFVLTRLRLGIRTDE